MTTKVRQGPLRQFIVDGMELDPAEGAEPSYRAHGRSGEMHMAGNGNFYMESNPHDGYVKQDVSADSDTYKKLKAIQNAGRFVSVSVSTAGDELLIGDMAIAGDPIEMANGIIALELHGKLSIQ